MNKKKTAKDVMLAHSKAKVDFYQNYLERYLSILSVSYFDTINIFDIFCGRGEYANGGLGSPIRAVQTIERIKKNRPSNLKINLFLNDAEKEYVNNVQKYIEAHFPDIQQHCNIRYLNAKVDNLFNVLCKILPQTAYNERNFLFIDPYGYKDINRDIFSQMMSNRKTEITLFLPISFMHRFRNYAFHQDAHNSAKPLRNFICQFFPANHPVCCDEEMDVLEYIDALKEALENIAETTVKSLFPFSCLKKILSFTFSKSSLVTM